MDVFSYSDIFATKGIEYLIIITFLALLVPFWLLLNRQVRISSQVNKALGYLSANILRIPHGLFYSKNHTWMYMEKSGAAKVGLDDLLLHITGEVKFSNLISPGEFIRKGDLMTQIVQKGKVIRIFSPLSGKILAINHTLNERPGTPNDDPYGKGWIYKIKPLNWVEEVKKCYFAEEATNWSAKEIERFKDFMALSMKNCSFEPSVVVMQDGGELCDHSLSEMPGEIWKDFDTDFLNSN